MLPPGVKWLLISNTVLFILYFFAVRAGFGSAFYHFGLVPRLGLYRGKDRLAPFIQQAPVGEALLDPAKLYFVQRTGHFLAVACDEWYGVALFKQIAGRLDLLQPQAQFGRDGLDEIHETPGLGGKERGPARGGPSANRVEAARPAGENRNSPPAGGGTGE